MDESVKYRKREDKQALGYARLENLFNKMEMGKDYEIRIRSFKDSKTNKQIRGFHGPMLDEMCEYTGYHKHEAKFILKDMFGEKEVIENKFTGETKVELLSLSRYKKDQMTKLISGSLMWMEAELGIVVDMKEKKRYVLDELAEQTVLS